MQRYRNDLSESGESLGSTARESHLGPGGFGAAPSPYSFMQPYESPYDFRGRGPKEYLRSDERLREVICDRLTEDAALDASEMIVTVRDSEVTLEGSVPNRGSKHRAEDLVDTCRGVKDIHNLLCVKR